MSILYNKKKRRKNIFPILFLFSRHVLVDSTYMIFYISTSCFLTCGNKSAETTRKWSQEWVPNRKRTLCSLDQGSQTGVNVSKSSVCTNKHEKTPQSNNLDLGNWSHHGKTNRQVVKPLIGPENKRLGCVSGEFSQATFLPYLGEPYSKSVLAGTPFRIRIISGTIKNIIYMDFHKRGMTVKGAALPLWTRGGRGLYKGAGEFVSSSLTCRFGIRHNLLLWGIMGCTLHYASK